MRNLYIAADAAHQALKQSLFTSALTSQFSLQDLDELLYLSLADVQEYARIVDHLLTADSFGHVILMSDNAQAFVRAFRALDRLPVALIDLREEVATQGEHSRVLLFQGERFQAQESAIQTVIQDSLSFAVFDRNLFPAYA